MALVEVLHDGQGFLGRKSIAPVGIPLQFGQIIKQRCRFGFALHGNIGYLAGLPFGRGHDGLGPGLVEDLVPAFAVAPFPEIITEISLDGPIIHRNKVVDLFLPFNNHSQSRGLYSSGRQLGVKFAGQSPGDIQPDQPVGLGSAHRGIIKIIIFMACF